MSLKTDSKSLAQEKAKLLWVTLLDGLEARLQGNSEDAAERFGAVHDIARSKGFRYLPVQDVARLPLDELLERVEVLQSGAGRIEIADAPALLGVVPKPEITISQALEVYWPLSKDKLLGKSEDQKRRWVNPRKKAIKNFIHVVGDVSLSSLTPDHMLDFREWWLERLQDDDLTANSANKDLSHLGHILKIVNNMKRLGHDLCLESLVKFKESDGQPRPPFSNDWIQNKLLAPGALDGLNSEARAIFIGMINTGYRPSEAAGLTAERIRLDSNIPHIIIAPESDREIKNKVSRRKIPLSGVSLEAFRQFPEGFPRYRENPASLSATVNKYLTENNLRETDKHVFYSLRHSFEDRLLRAGVDERIRRNFMGHSLGRESYGEGGGLEFQLEMIKKIAF